MHIGILETGATPSALHPRFGAYSAMFETMLGEEHAYTIFDVQAGRFPDHAEACQAYVITGSSSGVYDPDPWIAGLIDFLRAAKGRAGLVGICFGHQVMAQAFGGQVEKSDKGWGVGLHTYDVHTPATWMCEARSISIPVTHQDQVVALPPGARVLAGNAFTPYGALAYDDQPAISFQCHPEFEPAYAQALIAARRGRMFSEAQADTAIASLEGPNDRTRLAAWIGRFLDQNLS